MLQRRNLGALALAALFALGACTPDKPAFKGVDITGADYAKDFALSDARGQARSLKDFAGRVVVVFFGYTQCPDVCPTTLQELQEVKRMLGAEGTLKVAEAKVDKKSVFELAQESGELAKQARAHNAEEIADLTSIAIAVATQARPRSGRARGIEHRRGAHDASGKAPAPRRVLGLCVVLRARPRR